MHSGVGLTHLPLYSLWVLWAQQNLFSWSITSPLCKWGVRHSEHDYYTEAYMRAPCPIRLYIQNPSSKTKLLRISRCWQQSFKPSVSLWATDLVPLHKSYIHEARSAFYQISTWGFWDSKWGRESQTFNKLPSIQIHTLLMLPGITLGRPL